MSRVFVTFILISLLCFFKKEAFSQTYIQGRYDSLGRKQGPFIFLYTDTKHELMPVLTKTWEYCNYVNDTLQGPYRLVSDDSTHKFTLYFEKGKLYKDGCFIQGGKIRELYYFIDDYRCVNEYVSGGALSRSYCTKDGKYEGSYLCFEKGKIVIKRLYHNGVMINEEINRYTKNKK